MIWHDKFSAVINPFAKDGKTRCERPSFTDQKAVFCLAFCRLSQTPFVQAVLRLVRPGACDNVKCSWQYAFNEFLITELFARNARCHYIFLYFCVPVSSITCRYSVIFRIMKIGLFIPCYVDALYPDVGVAAYKLLKHLQVDVTYPMAQTCCGQPMANAGFEDKAVGLAAKYEDMFRGFDYVVAPSASCAAFVRLNYPRLLKGKTRCETAARTTDICEFLHDVLQVKSLPGCFPHKVSLHNSCHGVRELGLSSPSERNVPPFNKIKDLLQLVKGITVVEPEHVDECCGFGGMFSIEEPQVSTRMGQDKLARHMATGAEYITGPDSSCLMHLEGIARRQKKDIKFIHVVQILAAGL